MNNIAPDAVVRMPRLHVSFAVWLQLTMAGSSARLEAWRDRNDESGIDEAVTKMIWLAVGIGVAVARAPSSSASSTRRSPMCRTRWRPERDTVARRRAGRRVRTTRDRGAVDVSIEMLFGLLVTLLVVLVAVRGDGLLARAQRLRRRRGRGRPGRRGVRRILRGRRSPSPAQSIARHAGSWARDVVDHVQRRRHRRRDGLRADSRRPLRRDGVHGTCHRDRAEGGLSDAAAMRTVRPTTVRAAWNSRPRDRHVGRDDVRARLRARRAGVPRRTSAACTRPACR